MSDEAVVKKENLQNTYNIKVWLKIEEGRDHAADLIVDGRMMTFREVEFFV